MFHSKIPKEGTGALAYVVISVNFTCVIWRLSSEKTIILQISLIWVLNYFLINYTPKIIVQNVSKRNLFVKFSFVGSTSFQIRKKLQKLFFDKLRSCNLKIVFKSKAFLLSRKFYFQDLLTSISVVAAMLPIMGRPNSILKSEFVNI